MSNVSICFHRVSKIEMSEASTFQSNSENVQVSCSTLYITDASGKTQSIQLFANTPAQLHIQKKDAICKTF